jgi:hypothetical protein
VKRSSRFVLLALIVALGLAALAPLASSLPDGLERVVEDHGRQAAPGQPLVHGLMPDYELAGLGPAGTILAGLAGTLVVFASALLVARMISRRASRSGHKVVKS